jgi:predicted Zn-dependent protease
LSPLDPMLYFYHSLAASAALSAGNYKRVIELANVSLRSNKSHTSTYRVLAIAQVMEGKAEEAEATAKLLMALEPGFTVEKFLQRSPSSNYAIGKLCAQALRIAGIPERT